MMGDGTAYKYLKGVNPMESLELSGMDVTKTNSVKLRKEKKKIDRTSGKLS